MQTFVPEFTVKTFNVDVLLPLTRLDKSQLQRLAICPFIKRLADEFRTVVHGHRYWQSSAFCQSLQYAEDTLAYQRRQPDFQFLIVWVVAIRYQYNDLEVPISPQARVMPNWWAAIKYVTASRHACGPTTFARQHVSALR